MNLVKLIEERVMASSLDIAKHFDKEHKIILRSIRNLECSEEFAKCNFVLCSYEVNNRKQPYYLITKDGFSFLVMGFTGKKAAEFKEKYINAFNQMEKNLKALINKNDASWSNKRLEGKISRLSLTDTISKFVEYATAQGSTNAKFYYSNITKMEYKALGLLQQYTKEKNLRDSLNRVDLGFLQTAEDICLMILENGMNEGLDYKSIYQLAKERVNEYSLVINKARPIKALPSN